MADDPSKDLSRTSFSFERRGELPDHSGDFYQRSGESRDAFENARLRDKDLPPPEVGKSDEANDPLASNWREPRFQLPGPHPSFALPIRSLRNEKSQATGQYSDAAQVTKEDFIKAREQRAEQNRTYRNDVSRTR